MKNVFKLIGIIAMISIIGFLAVSCGNKCPKSTDGKHNWTAKMGGGTICRNCGTVQN